jgi:hypothetical protein
MPEWLRFKRKHFWRQMSKKGISKGQGNMWPRRHLGHPRQYAPSVESVEDTDAIEMVSPIRLDNFVGQTIPHTFFDQED